MALKNEILVGRYNRFLQKFLSMKGGPPSPQLASEIYPSWAMFHGSENRYLEGWDRFQVFGTQPAGGAGTFAKIQLRNPLGSNVVAVLEKIRFINSVALSIQMSSGDSTILGVDLATNAGTINTGLDLRGRRNATLIVSREATVGSLVGVIIDEVLLSAQVQTIDLLVTDIQEIPILPGFSYRWQVGLANTAQDFVLGWRERFLEESERS